MPIDLNNLSLEQKEAIRSALELNNVFTADDPATLTNKTLLNPVFSGTCSGQLNLASQVSEDDSSVLTRYTLRRELMMAESAIQRFNINRTYTSAGGAKTTGSSSATPPTMQIFAGLSNSATETIGGRNEWVDTFDRAGISTNATSTALDHTSWALKTFGTCYLDTASGGALTWNNPFSINLRINLAHTAQKVEYWAGICGRWVAGRPVSRGVGIYFDAGGYKLWSHSGITFAVTAAAGNTLLTTTGPHGFSVGDVILFSSMPSGNNILANTPYIVVEQATTNTFKISSTLNGTPIATTAALEPTGTPTPVANCQVVSLPTFSSYLTGFPGASNGFQTNQNILISSNGAGIASLYYSQSGNTNMSNTPTATIAVPSSGASIPTLALSCTCKSLNSGTLTNSAMAVVTASFAPFGV